MVFENSTREAMNKCYRLLAFRPRTEYELKSRLSQIGYHSGIIDEVMADLKNKGLLNDEIFSHDWVRWRLASKAVGKEYLRAELRYKGVDSSIIENTLMHYDEDNELKKALDLARNRLSRQGARLTKRKLLNLLNRRGFTGYVIKKAYLLLVDEGLI